MKIKFNNIRDLADARYAAAVMADYIGFSIGDENELPTSNIQEIIGWCSGPEIILEVKNAAAIEKLKALLSILPVNGLEVSANDYPAIKEAFSEQNLLWIIDAKMNGDKEFINVSPNVEAAEKIKETDPWGISMDCFESVSTGIKDFSDWNDFFETLEIL
ncbi:MAG: hypothetical protein RIT07_192 [Bacteroidota bacterium]